MKTSMLPRGLLIAVLFLCVCASSAISSRKLLNSAGALVDELEGLRQRLVESTGFSQPQWARKLQQAYPTVSYGDYGYGYYGYYGAYSSGGGNPYQWARRLLGDASSGEGNHARALKMAYPYPYGYGGYYGYYYGYGAYTPAMPYSWRRRVLGNTVERIAELLTDDKAGFVKPGDHSLLSEDGVVDPRRALKMAYDYPTNYGYSYGYGYYYGGSYSPNIYSW